MVMANLNPLNSYYPTRLLLMCASAKGDDFKNDLEVFVREWVLNDINSFEVAIASQKTGLIMANYSDAITSGMMASAINFDDKMMMFHRIFDKNIGKIKNANILHFYEQTAKDLSKELNVASNENIGLLSMINKHKIFFKQEDLLQIFNSDVNTNKKLKRSLRPFGVYAHLMNHMRIINGIDDKYKLGELEETIKNFNKKLINRIRDNASNKDNETYILTSNALLLGSVRLYLKALEPVIKKVNSVIDDEDNYNAIYNTRQLIDGFYKNKQVEESILKDACLATIKIIENDEILKSISASIMAESVMLAGNVGAEIKLSSKVFMSDNRVRSRVVNDIIKKSGHNLGLVGPMISSLDEEDLINIYNEINYKENHSLYSKTPDWFENYRQKKKMEEITTLTAEESNTSKKRLM